MALPTEVQSIDWAFARALLDQSDKAIFVFQLCDLRLVEANLRALELSGFSSSQLTEVRVDQLLESADSGFLEELIDACRGTISVELSESILLTRNDRSTVTVGVTISRLPAESDLLGLLVVQERGDELPTSEETFRQLAESISGVFWIQPIDGEHFLYVGPRFEEIWGRPSPVSGDAVELLSDAIVTEDRPRYANALLDLRQQGREFDLQYRICRPDGQLRWIRDRGFVIRDEAGNPVKLAGLAEDVTDATTALEKLRIQSCAVASATAGIVIVDVRQAQRPIVYCNDAFEQMTGYRRDQVLGRNCTFLHSHDRSQPEVKALQEAFSSGRGCSVELRNYRQDGSMFWSEVSISPITDNFGRVTHFVGFWNDVTERIAIESKLRDSEQRCRALVEHAPEAMMIFDVDGGCFVDWNKKALELFDTDAGTLRRLGPADFWPDALPERWDGAAEMRGLIAKAVDGEAPAMEFLHRDPSGQELTLEVRLIRLPAADRKLIRASLTDVTERRYAEEQLRRTRVAVESTSDAMFVIDECGQFVDVNRTSCERLGYTREELLNMTVADINRHYPMAEWPGHWDTLKDLKRLVFESEHWRKDGTVIPVEISKSFACIGGVDFAVAFVRDITERKQAQTRLREREAQLAHFSRLSTMGEMVAGIAHEVNQPLYSVLNFSKATKNKLSDPSEENLRQVAHWNEQITLAATRAGSIIKRLRGFVSQHPPEVRAMDINGVIREAIEIVGYEIRRASVRLTTELAPGPLYVRADAVQTQQVLVNLLVNAVEAIERGQIEQREIQVGSSTSDEFVEVFVADSGPGFPLGLERNLFDAFVSTKVGGMGMGLAISKTIVETAGGKLTACSNEQSGATFRFTLPMYREDEIV